MRPVYFFLSCQHRTLLLGAWAGYGSSGGKILRKITGCRYPYVQNFLQTHFNLECDLLAWPRLSP
jgi:hypothetical protein